VDKDSHILASALLGVDPGGATTTTISPTSAKAGTAFLLTVNGSSFDTNSAQIILTGAGCPAAAGCIVTHSALTLNSGTRVSGTVTVPAAGSVTVQILQVQSSGGSVLSNPQTLTVTP
jgi:hypothetical protein